MKKIQMKKIKCINLFLEKTSDLISIHCQKPEIWEEISKRNIRNFCFSGFINSILKYKKLKKQKTKTKTKNKKQKKNMSFLCLGQESPISHNIRKVFFEKI